MVGQTAMPAKLGRTLIYPYINPANELTFDAIFAAKLVCASHLSRAQYQALRLIYK